MNPVERITAFVARDPLEAPHQLRTDTLVALGAAVFAVLVGLFSDDTRVPDALGWALLAGSTVPLVWRRRRPVLVLLIAVCLLLPYHALDNAHSAPLATTFVALYTVAVTGRPLRTVLIGTGVVAVIVTVMISIDADRGIELLRISGWIMAILFIGVDVRIWRRYVASIVDRAERAERTREEEAARRVAEERLRIARDLHDLLAHSITLIGVQTSVASHVLTVDPGRLDRAAVAKALDGIAETCRDARAELRTTLEVLRADGGGDQPGEGPGHGGPLPELSGLPELVRSAEASGAKVSLSVAEGPRVPAAVGAAAYRIVQEALTNSVRHGGPGVAVRVEVESVRDADGAAALTVTVTDDGRAPEPSTPPGFGIIGMRERARSVGGTVTAGRRDGGGFAVTALLPLAPQEESRS
nr:histidine kinase [Streptomyces sp. GC420]